MKIMTLESNNSDYLIVMMGNQTLKNFYGNIGSRTDKKQSSSWKIQLHVNGCNL